MAQLFRDPACERWWLPHDEGFGPILRSTRAFADDRNAAAVNAQQTPVDVGNDTADMQQGLTRRPCRTPSPSPPPITSIHDQGFSGLALPFSLPIQTGAQVLPTKVSVQELGIIFR